MARTLLSFQPDNQDERLRQLLDGGSAPLGDTQEPQEQTADQEPDQNADSVAVQQAADPGPPPADDTQPTAAAPAPAPTPSTTPSPTPAAPPPSREDQILQMLMDERQQNARDPQLDARWKQAELGALDRADALQSANSKYGLGEFARDNGAALLASVLDIGFNRGRGLGGIVGATAQGVSQQEAARQAQIQQARDYALKIHQERGQHQPDPVSQMLALGRLDVAQRNAGTAGQRVQGTEAWRAQQSDPESAYRRTQVTQAGRTRTAATQAGLDVAHENNPRTAADRAAITAAQTGAQLGTQHEYAPITNQDAANRAGAESAARIQQDLNYAPQTTAAAAQKANAVAEAQIAPELQKQQAMNPILADRNNNGVGTGLSAEGIARANPGLEFGDQSLLQQALKTRTVNQKTMDDIKAANRGSEIVERLHDTADAYQQLIKADPSAIAGPQAAELRRQYKAHAQEYAGVIARVSGNTSIHSHDEALSLVPDIHNPYAIDGIKGLWSPLEANINGNLGAIGAKARAPAFLGGKSQQPGPATRQLPPDDNLGVTSGSPPKVNAVIGAPPPPNDLVTVKLGDQRAQVPRAQAQAMQQLNPALEIQ